MLDVSYFCMTSANQAEYVGAQGYLWWDSRVVDGVPMAEIKDLFIFYHDTQILIISKQVMHTPNFSQLLN